jgi:hypothetical protein
MGSTPYGITGIFHSLNLSGSHNGPGVHSATNRIEYQGYLLVVKAAGA